MPSSQNTTLVRERWTDPKIAAREASQQPATRHRPRAQPQPPAAAEDRRRRNRWRRSCRRRSHGWRNSKLRPQSPGFAVKPSRFTLIDPLFPEPQPAAAGEGCGAPGGGHPGAHQHPPDRRCERALNPKPPISGPRVLGFYSGEPLGGFLFDVSCLAAAAHAVLRPARHGEDHDRTRHCTPAIRVSYFCISAPFSLSLSLFIDWLLHSIYGAFW
jgi:hypothetical protein